MPVTIIWNDRDHTRTQHNFESPKDPELQDWLCDVLHDVPEHPDYEDYIEDAKAEDCGTRRLAFYALCGDDHHGDFLINIDNFGRGAVFLHVLSQE